MAERRRASQPSGADKGRRDAQKLPPSATIRIVRVGADGDGIATLPDGAHLYIPETLPDETIAATPIARRGEGWLASIDAIVEPSAARATPPCVHFGVCGGCTLQHWREAEYLAWKSGLLEAALRRAGFDNPVLSPITPGGTYNRRRMDLAMQRGPGGIRLGLHRTRSGEIVDLTECVVLHPTLFALLAPLRQLLRGMQALRRQGSVVANLLDSGADILLRTEQEPTLPERTAMIAFARTHDIARISWGKDNDNDEGEPICVLRHASTILSDVAVTPPPGGFLQATAIGEQAIVAAVLAGLPSRLPARARVADLYAGCGTITFALAKRTRVAAWEGDGPSVRALRAGINQAGLMGKVEVMQRDLARQPITPKELAGFAAIVLDPPHSGAVVQIGQIAAAKPPVVIYVSCNPGALARDAALLRTAGYRLERATPIDQFVWSSRLESVCVFKL